MSFSAAAGKIAPPSFTPTPPGWPTAISSCPWMTAPSPPTMPRPPAGRTCPSCWWCRRSLACTSTSRICAVAWRTPATWRWPPTCTSVRAMHPPTPTFPSWSPSWSAGVRRTGLRRSGRQPGLGRPQRRRSGPRGGHRLLLGRPPDLDVCRAQPGREGRRGLVRQAQRRPRPAHQALRAGRGARPARPGPGPVRRPRRQHSAGRRRQDEGQPGRRQLRRAAPRSWSTPRPTTASWPTIVPTTTPRPPRTAGAACWTGSRTTSNRPLARTPITGPRGAASPVRSGAPEERVALGVGLILPVRSGALEGSA